MQIERVALRRAAQLVRDAKVDYSGIPLDYVHLNDCPGKRSHDWCYACVNDMLERIADRIERSV